MSKTIFTKKHLKTLCAVILAFFVHKQAYAQATLITGQVVDAKTNETIVGASVKVKGSGIGTITDSKGNFSLNASTGAVLQVSYLGYTATEVTITTTKNITVKLVSGDQDLNEVIVIGYGTRKKETLTGSVSQVGAEVFKDRPVTNTALALQGQVPGLVIQRTSARPGNENLNIRIRGESSIVGVGPLIIIDGVPVIGDYELSQINPNDIESVSVLKDASAAIYGARAQGGVILVTTKRGKGKLQINYNGLLNYNTAGIQVPWANMSEWASLYLQTSTQDRVDVNGNAIEFFPQWNKANLERMANGESFDFLQANGVIQHYADNNWQDALYGTSLSNQQNLSVRGATEKTAFAFSLGYADNKSILKTAYDGEKKYTLRANYDYNITSKIKWETGLSFDNRTVKSPRNGIGSGFFDAPVFPVYNIQGQYYDDYGFRNPVAFTREGGTTTNNEGIARFNTRISAEILPGLKLSGTAALTKRDGWKTDYNKTFNLYSWLGDRINSTQYPQPAITESIGNTLYQNYGVYLDYNKTIAKKHNFAVFLGNTAELQDNKAVSATRTNLLFPDLTTLNSASTTTQTNTGTANHAGLTSYIGRFSYDFDKKYIIDFLGRSDASSRFADGYKRSNFYGISGAWIISEEKFFKESLKFINFLKIKGGYGETGGLASLGFYDYLAGVNINGTALFGTTPMLQGTSALSGITTNQRTWERMAKRNIALEFSTLNSRLNASFELFENKNIGMLINIQYPTVLGGSAPTTNSGIFRTRGWDATLNWKDKVGEFSYNIGLLLSDNKNKLVSKQGQDTWAAGKVAQRQGYALNGLFVYKTDGYFTTQAEADAYTAKYTAKAAGNLGVMNGNSKLRAGDLKVVDLDGDGIISATGDGKPGSGDVYYAGDSDPHYTFGTNMGFQYKGFDFSAFFQGIFKQNILRSGNARAPFFRNYLNVNTTYIGKTWTPENPNAEYPRLSFDNNRNNWNWQFNDVNIQNLSYIRLKSMIIGYTLPARISSKVKASRIRFYVSGNDLFEWTSVKDGFDPERGETADNSYPFLRTYSFGLDIGF
ncbi:SusC/RagA family TonB-linked outer membrane protein [Pedobacter rhodius]|uniref:TonB-dependent receptor n=1 Tax=Pedobacter rhodius TaxID=3004098 RepID=A0ABT4KZ39_9SPHI|nr:TonB-dependent receptor [Pedobacter sp. SJ11]MCZ4223472.1 TonB-dependent receptor [Pedobacter sp. SJ11]